MTPNAGNDTRWTPARIVDVLPDWNLVYLRPEAPEGPVAPLFALGLHRLTRRAFVPAVGMTLEIDADAASLHAVRIGGVEIEAEDTVSVGDSTPAEGPGPHVLDPRQEPAPQGSERVRGSSLGELQMRLRNGGLKQLPDVSQWRVGDLLLFEPLKPSGIERQLIAFQQPTFGDDHARWAHAAVYTGGYGVCEATLEHGVRASTIFPYVGRYRIRVRYRADLDHTDCTGHQIGIAALRAIGARYGMFRVVKQAIGQGRQKPAWWWPVDLALLPLRALVGVVQHLGRRVAAAHQSRRGTWPQDRVQAQHRACADVYDLACASGLKEPIARDENERAILCPAWLSRTDRLRDRPNLRWQAIDWDA